MSDYNVGMRLEIIQVCVLVYVNYTLYSLYLSHLCYTIHVITNVSYVFFSAKSYPTAYLSRATNFETKDMLAYVSFYLKQTHLLYW